jgi:hypothetical protein
MDLVGSVTNRDLAYRLDRVRAGLDRLPAQTVPRKTEGSYRLKRRGGEVAAAIAAVLADKSSMRFLEIQAAVERVLKGRVAPSTVKTCLARSPEFEKIGFGRYRLRNEERP